MVSLVKEEKMDHYGAIHIMYNALCNDLKIVALSTNTITIDELPHDLIMSSAKLVVRKFLTTARGYKGHIARSDMESEQIEKLVKLLVGYVQLQIEQNKHLIAAQKEMDAVIASLLK